MKIAFISRTLFPDIGGSESHVQEMAQWFAAAGEEVIVITSAGRERSIYQHPFDVREVRGLREFDAGADGFRVVDELHSLLVRETPDVIHVQNVLLAYAAHFATLSLTRPALVIADHNTPVPSSQRWLKGVANWELQIALARYLWQQSSIDAIVAFSQTFFDWANACGAPAEKLHLVYHGINTAKFAPGPPSPHVAQRFAPLGDKALVIAPGRVVPRKGHDVILRAVRRVAAEGRSIRLVFTTSSWTSDADLLASLLGRIADEGPLNIEIMVDTFTPSEMPDVYRSADLVVVHSEAEGFGLVGAEALATETPLIACNVQGLSEYVRSGENAVCVPYGSEEALAAAIVNVLDNPQQAKQRSAQGRRLVEAYFSLSRQCEQLLVIYERSISERMRRA